VIQQIVPTGPKHLAALIQLFEHIGADPEAKYFHPHPFTAAEAVARAAYAGPDIYVLMLLAGKPIGYGFLRGWDEHYAVPSLGVYVVEDHRGRGAASILMNYLHRVASLRGATRVRLKVHYANIRARRLYERLGYSFSSVLENNEFVGFVDLASAPGSPSP
jgi:GNAT superfamily N-acetyltransferase